MTPDDLEAHSRHRPDPDPEGRRRGDPARASAPAQAEPPTSRTPSSRPLGDLLVATTQRGLVGVYYEDAGELETLLDSWPAVCPARGRGAGARGSVRRELDEYFAGTRTKFDLPLDWSLTEGSRDAC